MGALVASRHNALIRTFHQRLIAAGKPRPSNATAKRACHICNCSTGHIGDTVDEIPSVKREIRDFDGQQVRLLEQRGKNLIDQDILER